MKIYCVCCGKQAVEGPVPLYDDRITTLKGARAAFYWNECYCGNCAKDMDDDGLFPEEKSY